MLQKILIKLHCHVLATFLVEKVGAIDVNGKLVTINYFVHKSVKIIISNAGYGITKSSIKRFLTKDCKIKTLSSVPELKKNMGQNNVDVYEMKSYRRFVYIHPDDVDKLPKKLVKFFTATTG